MNLITVREHARLTAGEGQAEPLSLDEAEIPTAAFNWMCEEMPRLSQGKVPLVRCKGRNWLRLNNYVGVLEAPCGTRIEILPKHVSHESDKDTAREVLFRMLQTALDLSTRESGPTSLQTINQPVSEWIFGQFLCELDLLVRRGLRFDYLPVEEELRFLRGRLRVAQQLRQPAGRQHLFQVEHQVYGPNRLENRLLASALDKVASLTRSPENWRTARELGHQLAEVCRANDPEDGFRRWSKDRLMSHYSAIRPWCELILRNRNPLATVGSWTGPSLLFPMERVFERYVEACLRRTLAPNEQLSRQVSTDYLCHQDGEPKFKLRPDFLIEHEGSKRLIDAKWKRLNSAHHNQRYKPSSSDCYQMFAYGQRYLGGKGQITLVYPAIEEFDRPLSEFDFGNGLKLKVELLNLKNGKFIKSTKTKAA